MNPTPIAFDLLQFTDRSELTRIIESFCNITGLAGGIVLMPQPGTPRPIPASDLHKLRVTNPEVVNPSVFCSLIRSCERGNMCCMDSDLKNAEKANDQGRAVHYRCHMGIYDLMAPIRVCGRHVANVYLGQIRPQTLAYERVRDRYSGLVEASGVHVKKRATSHELRAAFERLPSANKGQLENYAFFVETLASLISQRATRQAVVKMAVAAAREVGVTLNLRTGLEIYLRYAIALLNGDTGSIFLLDQNNPSWIESNALHWGRPSEAELRFNIHGTGIIAENARRNLEILDSYSDKTVGDEQPERRLFVSRFNNRGELDSHGPEQSHGTRDKRGLQSLLVVPICCGEEMLGTLDVGSKRKDAFSSDDEHVLRLFASVIGANVWMVRQRRRLVQLFGKHNALDLMQALVEEIPRDINGMGCSIFVRNGDGDCELAASSEFTGETAYSAISYQPGEGFTGWVLQKGIPLRIRGGRQCRTEKLERRWVDLGVRWAGKFRNYATQLPQNYYEDRPFLAVPVKSPSGVVVGLIRIADRRNGDFTEEDERTALMYADFLGHFLKLPPNARSNGASTEKPRVFLGHGKNSDATNSVRSYLSHIGCVVERYEEKAVPGDYSFDIVSRMVRESDVVVILYTGDDELLNGVRVGRRNVAHELGLAQGILGPQKTILLLENGVEKPTNVDGMQHIGFSRGNVQEAFEKLAGYLTKAGLLPRK